MDDDGDSKENKQIKRKGTQINFLQRYISNVSDVLSPLWIRRTIQINNGYEWFILGSRYRFLFYFRLFLVVVFLIVQIFK
jgi:hypothetical protein